VLGDDFATLPIASPFFAPGVHAIERAQQQSLTKPTADAVKRPIENCVDDDGRR
jgi:hypothetical protein